MCRHTVLLLVLLVCCTVSCLLFCAFVCLLFRPVTVVLGVAHPRETAPNTVAHGTAWFPTSPCVVANITMHYRSTSDLAAIPATGVPDVEDDELPCWRRFVFAT